MTKELMDLKFIIEVKLDFVKAEYETMRTNSSPQSSQFIGIMTGLEWVLRQIKIE